MSPADEVVQEAAVKAAYDQGFIDGLSCFAWWRDGVQYVGTSGTRLQDAVDTRRSLFNYTEPEVQR